MFSFFPQRIFGVQKFDVEFGDWLFWGSTTWLLG